MATKTQLNRLRTLYTQLAMESVSVVEIGGEVYALGSELVTLRLYRYYLGTGRQGRHETMPDTFYFTPGV